MFADSESSGIVIESRYGRGLEKNSLLYSSRRKFLTTSGEDCLEAPPEFQTRKQARRKHLQQKDQLFGSYDEEDDNASLGSVVTNDSMYPYPKKRNSSLFPMKLQNLIPATKKGSVFVPDKESLATKRLRRAGKYALGVVVLESRDVDNNQDNWREESKAGVTYWIHQSTGEIVTECPWLWKRKSLMQLSGSRQRLVASPSKTSMNALPNEFGPSHYSEGDFDGTGALVYDRSEIDELFEMLDSIDICKSSSKSTSTSAANTPKRLHALYPSDSPTSVKSI
eukprot:gene9334-10135_t